MAAALFVLISIGISVLEIFVFYGFERLMSQLADGAGSSSELTAPILIFGVMLLGLVLLNWLSDPFAYNFRNSGVRVLIQAMAEKVERLELITFETVDANERIELAKSGLEACVTMLTSFLFPLLSMLFVVMTAFYLYTLSPLLALLIPLVFMPRAAAHVVRGSRYYKLERATVPALREYQYLESCLVDREYFKETRILGAGAAFPQRYRSVIDRFNVRRWREDTHIAKIDLALNVLVLCGYGGSYLLAALLVSSGAIGVGGFAVAVYAASRLMLTTGSVMDMVGDSYRRSATAAHLFEFLSLGEGRPPEDRAAAPEHAAAAAAGAPLQASAVSFTYPGTDRPAVSGIDLEVPHGMTVALVGANGAGKSTLAKLLLGLYVPTGGRVLRRGVDTREAARSAIRAGTSAVFQNFQRYRMSLRDNVTMAEAGAAGGESQVLQALRDGGVAEELGQGPDGLEVMLSREFGTRDLSLGQWQRLAIARGLFRRHDTILLDEPTASIDPLEEQAVYERFMKIAAGRTALIVTHRLASARLADRILVLDGGRIVEDGTHHELLARGGLYHRMFTAQAAWYEREP